MSMFEDEHFRWRETYFVLFDSRKRPTLNQMKHTLSALSDRYTLTNLSGDRQGRFESLTLLAPDDFAALDICYVSGDEVREQGAQLVEEMKSSVYEGVDQSKLKLLSQCDGRLDVLHFEQLTEATDEQDEEEMLDPGAMLIVLGAMVKLTEGIAVDPQSGTMM